MTQRADLDVRLQAAVAERDEALARRLADQLVHRRGLAALQALLQGPLLRFQGEEAVGWLQGLVQLAQPGTAPAGPLRAVAPHAPISVDVHHSPQPPSLLWEDQEQLWGLTGNIEQGDGAPEPEQEPEPESEPESEPERIAAIQLPAGLNLSLSCGAASPAPAPASLAALRSWLPGEHDLPEAC